MHEQRIDLDPGDLLEAYIDGELSEFQTQQLEGRLQRDSELAQQLDLARRIRQELRALPHHACPPDVGNTPVDFQAARRSLRPQVAQHMGEAQQRAGKPHASWRSTLRPLLAAAAVLATVFALRPTPETLIAPRLQSTAPETAVLAAEGYSAAEVAQAQEDVKRALAYLGQFGATASQRVQEDLVQQRWARPLQRLLPDTPAGN